MSEPTRVTVTLGYTRNMGNFESLRVDIGVEDSRRENETAGEAFDRVYAFVESRLTAKVAEIEKELNSVRSK